MKNLWDRIPREIKPVQFQDEVAYDSAQTMSALQFGLRMMRVKTERVEVKSDVVANAVELVFDTTLPKGFTARGTVRLTPVNGRTELKVEGESDLPFANAAVRGLLTKAIDLGNGWLAVRDARKAAAPDASQGPRPATPEAPRRPEGPTTPGA